MRKLILLSGAASGMGRAMAVRFASQGHVVVASDINPDGLEATKAEVVGAGNRLETIVADVGTQAGAERMVEAALAVEGRLDVLINCAGLLDGMLLAHEVPIEIWHRVIATNLTGPFLTSRLVLPAMLKQGSGLIINFSSIAGLRGGRSGVAYAASKHGVIGLSRSLAAAYGDQGVRCITVCPGATTTSMPTSAAAERSKAGTAMADRSAASVPNQKLHPSKIAEVVEFLISDGAAHLNGSEIVVDGGQMAF
jgi:NAD(P)-dependent dehydrogenase (short-subunit alcohol dehydrogenase family)